MTSPTQEQIKADVVSLLPGMIGCTSFDLYYWIDTGRPITAREWLMVAHEAEKLLDSHQIWKYVSNLVGLVKAECIEEYEQAFTLLTATSDQHLEAIHRVCFPEKWRDA